MFSKMTITLSKAEVEDLIRDAVERKMDKEVVVVRFNVFPMAVGFGVGERDEHQFTGCSIDIGE